MLFILHFLCGINPRTLSLLEGTGLNLSVEIILTTPPNLYELTKNLFT